MFNVSALQYQIMYRLRKLDTSTKTSPTAGATMESDRADTTYCHRGYPGSADTRIEVPETSATRNNVITSTHGVRVSQAASKRKSEVRSRPAAAFRNMRERLGDNATDAELNAIQLVTSRAVSLVAQMRASMTVTATAVDAGVEETAT